MPSAENPSVITAKSAANSVEEAQSRWRTLPAIGALLSEKGSGGMPVFQSVGASRRQNAQVSVCRVRESRYMKGVSTVPSLNGL